MKIVSVGDDTWTEKAPNDLADLIEVIPQPTVPADRDNVPSR
jgi:hypothetical protein